MRVISLTTNFRTIVQYTDRQFMRLLGNCKFNACGVWDPQLTNKAFFGLICNKLDFSLVLTAITKGTLKH